MHRSARIPAALQGGTVILVFGLAVTGCSSTAKDEPQQVAAAVVDSASPSPSVTPSMDATSRNAQQTVNDVTLFCTEGEDGDLVWMDMAEYDRVIAAVAAEKEVKPLH